LREAPAEGFEMAILNAASTTKSNLGGANPKQRYSELFLCRSNAALRSLLHRAGDACVASVEHRG
jgi:hypothetical protein